MSRLLYISHRFTRFYVKSQLCPLLFTVSILRDALTQKYSDFSLRQPSQLIDSKKIAEKAPTKLSSEDFDYFKRITL